MISSDPVDHGRQLLASVRAAVAQVRQGRAAAGRPEPPLVVVYLEVPDPGAADLRQRVLDLADAGADSVVLQPTGESPDPLPLIEVIAGWS